MAKGEQLIETYKNIDDDPHQVSLLACMPGFASDSLQLLADLLTTLLLFTSDSLYQNLLRP